MIRPILPLSPGHLSLILASGMLDGVITLDDGRRVLMRGVSSKTRYTISDKTESRGGVAIRAETTGEKPILKIRVMDEQGNITEYIDA